MVVVKIMISYRLSRFKSWRRDSSIYKFHITLSHYRLSLKFKYCLKYSNLKYILHVITHFINVFWKFLYTFSSINFSLKPRKSYFLTAKSWFKNILIKYMYYNITTGKKRFKILYIVLYFFHVIENYYYYI